MRRISPATITIAVFAILLALVAAWFAKRFMFQPTPLVAAPDQVVVSRVNLTARDQIRRRILELRPLKPGEPQNALRTIDVAAGRFVKEKVIPADQPITDDMLFPIGENPITSLRDRIADGKRAKTIQVTGLIHGTTLVRPGSIVDISVTVETDHPEVKDPGLKGIMTKTFMRAVKLLGVINPRQAYREGRMDKFTTIVVEVTPDQANALTLAEKIGTLSASVVGPGDPGPGAGDQIISPNDLLALLFPPAPPPPPPPLEPYRVEHWRGGLGVQYQTFGPEQVQEAQRATAYRQPTPWDSPSGGANPTNPRGNHVPTDERTVAPVSAPPRAEKDQSDTQARGSSKNKNVTQMSPHGQPARLTLIRPQIRRRTHGQSLSGQATAEVNTDLNRVTNRQNVLGSLNSSRGLTERAYSAVRDDEGNRLSYRGIDN